MKYGGPQELRTLVTFEKGKPPIQQPYFGPSSKLYLTPEYLRGGAQAEPIKAGVDSVEVKDGDTIVLWDGSNAGEALTGRQGVLASTMTLLKPVYGLDRDYFYYAVKGVEPVLKAQTAGSGIPHVDKEVLGRQLILVLGKPEQAIVASVLSCVDSAIERMEANIAKHLRVEAGLMQTLLTCGIDDRGIIRSEETHEFRESPIGRIPSEWRTGGILDFAARSRQPILTGPFGASLGAKDFIEDGVPVLRIGNVQAGYIDHSDLLHVSEKKAEELARYRVEPGDLLFARQGATTGRNALAGAPEKGFVINYHIIRVAVDGAKCSPIFLHAAFNSHNVKSQVEREKGKGTREGVNTATLRSFVLPIPAVKEQYRIADALQAHRTRSLAMASELRKLRSLKLGLMQDLLTGRKRVTALLNDAAAPEVAHAV